MIFPRIGIRGLLSLLLLFGCGEGFLIAQAGTPADYRPTAATPAQEDYLYFDLACNDGPFTGYFSPGRWDHGEDTALEITSKVAEDGEYQDMTGIIFTGPRRGTTTWSILIPAAGYLSFHLNPPPLNNASTPSIFINGENISYQVRSDGLFYSPYLQKGDRFTLRIPPGREIFHWSSLVFHTNFNAVVVRPTERSISRRFVPIKEGKIQRVFFPQNVRGGWPIYDEDGDRNTSYDQVELRQSNETFDVEYDDIQVFRDGQYVLERTFTIREKCRTANTMQRSRSWAPLPIIVSPGDKG